MNQIRYCLFLGLVPVLVSCASMQPPLILEPVGPPPLGRAEITPTGLLRVYTATERHQDGDDTYYYPHSDYAIYTESGRVLKHVGNHIGTMDESPACVTLPVGAYEVNAWTERCGRVIVPVVIRRGQTTSVYLEEGWRPANTVFDETELVRLPSGSFAGWRAKASQ